MIDTTSGDARRAMAESKLTSELHARRCERHSTTIDSIETGRRFLEKWEELGEETPAPMNLAEAALLLVEFAEQIEAGNWEPCDAEHIAAMWLIDACHAATATVAHFCGYDPALAV